MPDAADVSPPPPPVDGESRGIARHLSSEGRARLAGPVAMLTAVGFFELLSHTPLRLPSPVPIGLLALVYATFRSGVAAGLLSAGIFLLYDLYFLAAAGSPLGFDSLDMRRLAVLAAVMPAIVVLVGRFRRQAEQLVKVRTELLRQLVHAEEEERRRLSRRLHDQMGQHLAALTLGLQRLEPTASSAPEASKRLGDLRALVDRIDHEVRRIAVDLRPASLDDLGLSEALGQCVREWSERSGVPADFQAIGLSDRPLSPSVETALYRVVQEALTNVLKHARATRVSVVAERREGEVLLIVEDDGAGFDGGKVRGRKDRRERGLGLVGIREGVQTLGGTVTVESAPSRGTSVFVRIPAADEERPDA